MYSVPCFPSRIPKISGRMPCGSRNARMPTRGEQRDNRVSTPATTMHAGNRSENLVLVEHQGRLPEQLQLVREHVEYHFGIRAGSQMPQILIEQFAHQLPKIRQVAIVPERNAVGAIYIKWLRLRRVRATRGRITHVTDPRPSFQSGYIIGAKHIAHQTVTLALIHMTGLKITADYTGGVLATVLKQRQCVIQILPDAVASIDADHATHQDSPNDGTKPAVANAVAERDITPHVAPVTIIGWLPPLQRHTRIMQTLITLGHMAHDLLRRSLEQGKQQRRLPPIFNRQRRQPREQHQTNHDDNAANQPEHGAQKAVDHVYETPAYHGGNRLADETSAQLPPKKTAART